MYQDIITSFFKENGLYNEEYFKLIETKTLVIDKPYEEIKDFVGCLKKNNDFKLILPRIVTIYDLIIWIHEYTHALFLDDESEIFPNIMESCFINQYILDEKVRLQIIEKTKQEIDKSVDLDHTIAKKIKLLNIRKS